MTVEISDISDISMFNMDVRAEVGYPTAVSELRRKLQDAAGLIIASPEYNNSLTGVLKNTIDWLSTGADSPLDRKPTAILGAGGRLGTSRSQAALRVVLANNNVAVLNRPEVLLAGASSHFDDDLNLTNERSQDQIRRLMFALAGQIRLHQSREQALILGDDDEVLSGAARLLDEAGYDVHTTTDPSWAVSQLKPGGLSLCVLATPFADNEEIALIANDTGTRVVVLAGIDGFLDALDQGST